jgi:hypothetical protein
MRVRKVPIVPAVRRARLRVGRPVHAGVSRQRPELHDARLAHSDGRSEPRVTVAPKRTTDVDIVATGTGRVITSELD